MSIRHFPFSNSVIVNVLRAIILRSIPNNSVYSNTSACLFHQQPLISTWKASGNKYSRRKLIDCSLQKHFYSTQTSPLLFDNMQEPRNAIQSGADHMEDYNSSNASNTSNSWSKTKSRSYRVIDKVKGPDGELIYSKKVFKMKPKKKPTTAAEYNHRMSFAVMENRVNKAIHYLREMEQQKIKPDVCSYTMIINCYSKQSDMKRARKWLARMLKNGIQPDAYVYTSFIDGYMREANIDEAENMFRIMMDKKIKPSLVTYNILMHHSVRKLNMESALKFWDNLLKAGLKSDVYTFAIIMHGLGEEGRVDEAWRIFQAMEEEKVSVNEVVATTLMGMHVKQRDNEYAINLFRNFFENESLTKLKPSNHTRNVLLNAIIAPADNDTIQRYYDEYKHTLTEKEPSESSLFIGASVYTYTTFMKAFLRRDNLAMVSQVYADMTARSVQPSLVTYATLMLAHAYVPDPESCSRILQELKKGGLELNAVIYTIVMRAWSKAGNWNKVKETYEQMKEDNIEPSKLTMEVLRYSQSINTVE